MNQWPRAETANRWIERPLCRRYEAAAFRGSAVQLQSSPNQSQVFWWALGTLGSGDVEVLGAWRGADERAALPSNVFGQLAERGVISIRFCVGAGEEAGIVFRETFRHAAVVPSVEALVASAALLARPRHRPEVLDRLRSMAESDCGDVARTELAAFQASKLGERYPGIVRQWDEALARFEPLYALDAPLREIVRSADRAAWVLSERLNRAIKSHGPFIDPATALAFVVAWLVKAERGLERERTPSLLARAVRPGFLAGSLSAGGAVGVPTSA